MSNEPVGSWHVDGHNMAAIIRKTVDGWETVARCPNENGTWREDARLIAAAPDMLEAFPGLLALLRNAQDVLSIYLSPDGYDADKACAILLELLDGPRQREAEKRAWAAIAKAEGRS